jgi:hypothetical protein
MGRKRRIMQILLSKKTDVHALTEETKHELKFLWFPIIENFPKRLIWLEWVTYGYNKDTTGSWLRISTTLHGVKDPRSPTVD